MKRLKASDAVVDADDAISWAAQLLRETPQKVIDRALEAEPFVLGLSMDVARRTADRLLKRGVPEWMANEIIDRIVLGSAYSIELMRRGHAKLWADVIEPTDVSDQPNQGDHHE